MRVVKMESYMLRIYLAMCLFVSMSAQEYSDCPVSLEPASINPQDLKNLHITVMNKHNSLTTKYNYYNIGYLAKDPDIDFRKKTFLYCAGYLDSTVWPVARLMGIRYKELGYNVLLLETIGFTARVYPRAASVIRTVGKNVAQMLANLTSHGLDPAKMELMGLSLGGQTMSFIAKNYRKITGRNISTLVGLDAAGPCFRNLGPDERLDSSDADFVLAIVTNMHGFGMRGPVGHVTFYVNGGAYQPGEISWLPCDEFCSHARAYFLWLSALYNPGSFIGVRCDSLQKVKDGDCFDLPMVTNTFDMYTDRSKSGIYYLKTSNVYPYALGKKGLIKGETFDVSRYINFNGTIFRIDFSQYKFMFE